MAFTDFYITRRMIIIWIAIPGIIIILTYAAYFNYKGAMQLRDYHFNGAVDSVSYDIKGFSTVIIKGSHFYLGSPAWYFNPKIQKGDTLIKQRNSLTIKLIRRNGQVAIESDKSY